MDGEILALIIPGAALVGGAIGWLVGQFRYRREARRQADNDASTLLNGTRTLLSEMLENEKDADKKSR